MDSVDLERGLIDSYKRNIKGHSLSYLDPFVTAPSNVIGIEISWEKNVEMYASGAKCDVNFKTFCL